MSAVELYCILNNISPAEFDLENLTEVEKQKYESIVIFLRNMQDNITTAVMMEVHYSIKDLENKINQPEDNSWEGGINFG